MSNRSISRRDLLRYGAALGAGASFLPGLRVLSAGQTLTDPRTGAQMLGGPPGYRALVCVFLNGGMDGFNVVVPRGTPEYTDYASARQVLAVPQPQVVPIHPTNPDGREWGFGPELPEMAARFEEGRLAIVANVGSLIRPTTKAEFLGPHQVAPEYLYSHSDQHDQWFTGTADRGVSAGWCGRIADALLLDHGPAPLPVCISCTGEARQMVGAETSPYFLDPGGLETFEGLKKSRLDTAFRRLAGEPLPHPMQRRYAEVQQEAMSFYDTLSGALSGAPAFDGVFPATSLGDQLRTVAQVIAVRGQLGVKRQIFFVDDDGYDTHEEQPRHLPGLLRNLSRSLGAFQTALESIRAEQDVTTFTSSEFGRALSSNGKGCDHGWGNVHLVMGGEVLGRTIYGTMPELALGSPDDVDQGRMLPTQSVDQYAATLARWFGLREGEIRTSFPNLANFPTSDLGFFGTPVRHGTRWQRPGPPVSAG